MARDVYVVATAAVTPFGLDAAALLAGLRGERAAYPSTLLAATHPSARAVGVAAVPAAFDPVPPKSRKTMSRGAYLGAVALRALVAAARWPDRDGVGYFLGVGASGGSMSDLEAILAATLGGDTHYPSNPATSVENSTPTQRKAGDLDLERFGTAGIPACNPLLAFQLMNNFTMCHGAILEGTTGPSGAFFSRGAGTIAALIEAREAVAGGDCARAIAGGADSALHPVTWIEHQRLADTQVRLPAGEGAALVALAAEPDAHAIVIEAAEQVTRADDPAARAAAIVEACGVCDVIVVGADDARQRDALVWPFDSGLAESVRPERRPSETRPESKGRPPLRVSGGGGTGSDAGAGARSVIELDGIGTCLAATPALGWVTAIEAVRAGARRAAVITLDGAGDLAVAVFARRATAMTASAGGAA